MKRSPWVLLYVLGIVLIMTSCAPETNTAPIPPIILETAITTASNKVQASAEVISAQETRLSFVISGLVKEVNVTEGDIVKEGQPLLSLDMSEQGFVIEAAEAALYSAEVHARLQRIRNRQDIGGGKFIYTSGPREQIIVADAKVEQRRAALDTAIATHAQGTILATFDGTVVEINISSGEYAQTSQVVIVLATMQDLQIETTDLSELNIAAVKIGQSATAFVEALDEEIQGTVISISPISDTIGGDVVFKVTIQLDEQPHALLWGMSADIEISLE